MFFYHQTHGNINILTKREAYKKEPPRNLTGFYSHFKPRTKTLTPKTKIRASEISLEDKEREQHRKKWESVREKLTIHRSHAQTLFDFCYFLISNFSVLCLNLRLCFSEGEDT